MISRIIQGVKTRWFLFYMQRVDRLTSRGNFEGAIQLLSRLKTPQNYKSICLAKTGDCYLHIGKLRDAESFYRLAMSTEISWEGRQNKQNKKYILAYCKFFLATIFAKEGDKKNNAEYSELLATLRAIPASPALVNHILPPP